MSDDATVYRIYGEHDDLLYVGSTTRWPYRIREHARMKAWWDDVRSVTAEHFDDLTTALAAEREAQATEAPAYNRRKAPLSVRRRPVAARGARCIVAAKIPVALAAEISALATENDRSVAAEIRLALKAWVEDADQKAAA